MVNIHCAKCIKMRPVALVPGLAAAAGSSGTGKTPGGGPLDRAGHNRRGEPPKFRKTKKSLLPLGIPITLWNK